MNKQDKTVKVPLMHVVKRDNVSPKKAWLVRSLSLLSALLVCGIISSFFDKNGFGVFFTDIFKGTFGTERRIWNLLQGMAILLCIALAVTPAFKMRFWNIGAEGQVLTGALASVVCVRMFGGKIPEGLLLVVMLGASMVAGAAWAVIPAIFKAKWNTNETLFTLMMNYIAIQLVSCCINIWAKSGSGFMGMLKYGHFPQIGGKAYLLNILIVTVLTAVMYIYLRYSKHGYEIAVVGESENTARYIGINVKKVIIRTMILSGVICGIAGLLLVGGTSHSITVNTAGGRGFTAILVSWLAKFNPLYMILTTFLVIFVQQGSAQVDTTLELGGSYPGIITGVFFFFIIGCEFFINYQLKFRHSEKEVND